METSKPTNTASETLGLGNADMAFLKVPNSLEEIRPVFSARAFDPIYRVDFYLVFSDNIDILKAAAETIGPKMLELVKDNIPNEDTYGVCYSSDNASNQLIYLSPEHTGTLEQAIQSLCHESLHATNSVLMSVGLQMDHATEEAFAYYQSFILRSFLPILLQWKNAG